VVRIEAPRAQTAEPSIGTGVIVRGLSNRSYVLTSTHVAVPDATGSTPPQGCIPLPHGTKMFQGNSGGPDLRPECAYHLGDDISLIKLLPRDDPPYPNLPLVARDLREGDRVYIAGFPLGNSRDTNRFGHVTETSGQDETVITNILTAEGMSGGPYLAIDGIVVGIHRGGAKYTAGFAHMVPISKIRLKLEPHLGQLSTQKEYVGPQAVFIFITGLKHLQDEYGKILYDSIVDVIDNRYIAVPLEHAEPAYTPPFMLSLSENIAIGPGSISPINESLSKPALKEWVEKQDAKRFLIYFLKLDERQISQKRIVVVPFIVELSVQDPNVVLEGRPKRMPPIPLITDKGEEGWYKSALRVMYVLFDHKKPIGTNRHALVMCLEPPQRAPWAKSAPESVRSALWELWINGSAPDNSGTKITDRIRDLSFAQGCADPTSSSISLTDLDLKRREWLSEFLIALRIVQHGNSLKAEWTLKRPWRSDKSSPPELLKTPVGAEGFDARLVAEEITKQWWNALKSIDEDQP
jgi:hypothetical protein